MQRAGIVLCGEISGMGKECVGSRTWLAESRDCKGPYTLGSDSAGASLCRLGMSWEWHPLYLSARAGVRLRLLTRTRWPPAVISSPAARPETGNCTRPGPEKSGHLIHNWDSLLGKQHVTFNNSENWNLWPVTVVAEINICIISCSTVYFQVKYSEIEKKGHEQFVMSMGRKTFFNNWRESTRKTNVTF